MTQPRQPILDRRDVNQVRDYNFVAALIRLVPRVEGDRVVQGNGAALAVLRRAAGRAPAETPLAFPAVYDCLNGEPLTPWEEVPYLLVAPLFALYPHGNWEADRVEPQSEPRSLGASFAHLAERTGSGSIEGRFRALLESHFEDLHEHLRHAVRLLRAHEVQVSWTELLGDIRRWDDDRRPVQRKWARHFWRYLARAERDQASQAGPDTDNADQ